MKTHRLIPFVCLISLLPASALPPTIKLRAMTLGPIEDKELWLKSGEGFIPLAASDVQPSDPVRVPVDGPLLVFRGPLDAKGRPSGTEPIKLELPSDRSELLLLAAPTSSGTRILAIPDLPGGGQRDSWLFVNATPQQAAFQVDEVKPIAIDSGGHRFHKMSGSGKRGAAIRIAVREPDMWKPVYSTYWPVESGSNSIVLIIHDGQKVRVKLIDNPADPSP